MRPGTSIWTTCEETVRFRSLQTVSPCVGHCSSEWVSNRSLCLCHCRLQDEQLTTMHPINSKKTNKPARSLHATPQKYKLIIPPQLPPNLLVLVPGPPRRINNPLLPLPQRPQIHPQHHLPVRRRALAPPQPDKLAHLPPLVLERQPGRPRHGARVVRRPGAGRALVVEVRQRVELGVRQQPEG